MNTFEQILYIFINQSDISRKIISKYRGSVYSFFDDEEDIGNQRKSSRNTSGYNCVSKCGQYWVSHYYANGMKNRLYSGKDFQEAVSARRFWEIKNGF